MSAEVLREAAVAIRAEWGPQRGSAWSVVQNFHLAVADWLDREATLHESMLAMGDLLNLAAKELDAGEIRLQFSDAGDQMAASTMPQAIAVANAYLGKTP